MKRFVGPTTVLPVHGPVLLSLNSLNAREKHPQLAWTFMLRKVFNNLQTRVI